jgi:hypothetical protein
LSLGEEKMIIRREQFRAFEKNAVQEFISRMEKRLREVFPEELANVGQTEAQSKIGLAIDLARRYGLTRECDVEGYLIVICASSVGIGVQPPDWMIRILEIPGTSSEDRIALLYRECEERRHGR